MSSKIDQSSDIGLGNDRTATTYGFHVYFLCVRVLNFDVECIVISCFVRQVANGIHNNFFARTNHARWWFNSPRRVLFQLRFINKLRFILTTEREKRRVKKCYHRSVVFGLDQRLVRNKKFTIGFLQHSGQTPVNIFGQYLHHRSLTQRNEIASQRVLNTAVYFDEQIVVQIAQSHRFDKDSYFFDRIGFNDALIFRQTNRTLA